jgi:hypothetical protein
MIRPTGNPLLPPRIVLIARRNKDLQDDRPDYSIWADGQRVSRIYRKYRSGDHELWFWGVDSVICHVTSAFRCTASTRPASRVQVSASSNLRSLARMGAGNAAR